MEQAKLKKLLEKKQSLLQDYIYFKLNLDLYNQLLLEKHQNKESHFDVAVNDFAQEIGRNRLISIIISLTIGVLIISPLPFILKLMGVVSLSCYNGKIRKKTTEKYRSEAQKNAVEEADEKVDTDTLYDLVFDARCEYHRMRREYEEEIATLTNEEVQFFTEYMESIEYISSIDLEDTNEKELEGYVYAKH